MSVEQTIAEAVATALNPRADAQDRKLDAILAVLVDIASTVRKIDAGALTLSPSPAPVPTPVPTPAPIPVPTPAPAPLPPGYPPVVAPAGSVVWDGSAWTLDAAGRILRDGKPATNPDYTVDVVTLWVESGELHQKNNRGEIYKWSGQPDWTPVKATPGPTITSNGVIEVA